MKQTPSRLSAVRLVCMVAAVVALGVLPGTNMTFADQDVIFTIDPGRSATSWSGTDNRYGAFGPQAAGSLNAPVSGNFIVSFDPTTDSPSAIRFVGNGSNNNNGFFELATNPGPFSPFGLPANLAGTTSAGDVQFAIRNLVWNFNSSAIGSTGTVGLTNFFPATTTYFAVSSGGIDYKTPSGQASASYVNSTDHVSSGMWALSESAPGSGNWTLGLTGSYSYAYNNGTTAGSLTASGTIISTAHYNVSGSSGSSTNGNVATVPQPTSGPVQAQVLGGSGTVGGVTANVDQTITGGTLSIQQVPGIASLTQAAVTAGQNNPIFALSTNDVSIGAPQIWNVEFGGNLDGSSASLVFHYDPTALPPGTDPTKLGIWHFNRISQQWEFGGTVDPANDTITFQTSNFSPFALGIAVPEPSTLWR